MPELTVERAPLPRMRAVLLARLRNRPALTGLPMFTAEVNPDEVSRDGVTIMFGDSGDDRTPGSNSRHRVVHELTQIVVIVSYADGAGEDAILEAEEKAYDVFAEFDAEIRGSVAGGALLDVHGERAVSWVRIPKVEQRASFEQGKRWCALRITLTAHAETIASSSS